MSDSIHDDPGSREHRRLVDQIAILARPQDLAGVSDAELEAMLDAHAGAAFSPEETERLVARFWTEVSRPPTSQPALPIGDEPDGTPAAPKSPVLGFLGNLMKGDGWPSSSTFSGYMIAVLAAVTLALSVVVVLLVLGFPFKAAPKEVAQSPPSLPSPSGRGVGGEGNPLPPVRSPQPPAPSVACVSRLCDVRWAGPQLALGEKARLTPGQDIKLNAGRTEITFDAGVQMVVEGPAHVRILDPLRIQAYSGNITARVGKNARGFSVLTPQGRVVDLGTEFGLRIDGSGREDIAVFEGAVDLDYGPAKHSRAGGPGTQATRRLVQGEAVCVGSRGEMTRLVAITDKTFPRQVQPPPERRPVITSVTDNFRKPDCKKFYEIVHGALDDRVRAYVDWTRMKWGMPDRDIPAALRGADYVKTFNEDMERRDIEITVHLACAADLYIFVDDRAMPPEWLKRFRPTGWKIVLDEGHPDQPHYKYPGKSFTVWRLSVPAAQDVTLGGTGQYSADKVAKMNPLNADLAMYGIAAVAREASPRPSGEKQGVRAGEAASSPQAKRSE